MPIKALQLIEAPSAKGRKIIVMGRDGRQRHLTNKTGKVSELDPAHCIGCGVCAYKCPSQSLTLERKEIEHHPPQTARDWLGKFITNAQ